jgi:hypothetical protein
VAKDKFKLFAYAFVVLTAPNAHATADRNILFVQGNIEFILLHELAHVIISDFDIPIIGPEESAADYIATVVLIRAEQFSQERADRARLFVGAVANGFATEWDVQRPVVSELAFWDSHALGIQRFFQIGCLLHGSSPATFAKLPARIGMPKERATQCIVEFQKAARSIDWMLDAYGKTDDQDGAVITIDYQKVPSRVSQTILAEMRNDRIFENTIRRIRDRFALPQPLAIVIRSCGKPTAIWDPAIRTVTVCYELFDYYYLLARNSGAKARDNLLKEETSR